MTASELKWVIPPSELLAKLQERHDRLRGTERPQPFSEIEVVGLAADIIAKRLRARGEGTEREYMALSEQLIWVFNTYSGIAHAFAWPTMVPGGDQPAARRLRVRPGDHRRGGEDGDRAVRGGDGLRRLRAHTVQPSRRDRRPSSRRLLPHRAKSFHVWSGAPSHRWSVSDVRM